MHIFTLGESVITIVLRAVTIYFVLLLSLRAFGKREIGQFTLFDLVFILLVANAVQPAITGNDNSLTGGLVIIATLILLNFALSRLRLASPLIARILEPRPVVLAKDGIWNQSELRRQGISDEECLATLREHGLGSITEAELVELEADGTLSVVPKNRELHGGRRRRVRFTKRG